MKINISWFLVLESFKDVSKAYSLATLLLRHWHHIALTKTSCLRKLKTNALQVSTQDHRTGAICHFLVPAYCQGLAEARIQHRETLPTLREEQRLQKQITTSTCNNGIFYCGKMRVHAMVIKNRTILKLEPIF